MTALLVEAPAPLPTQSVNVFGEVNGVSLMPASDPPARSGTSSTPSSTKATTAASASMLPASGSSSPAPATASTPISIFSRRWNRRHPAHQRRLRRRLSLLQPRWQADRLQFHPWRNLADLTMEIDGHERRPGHLRPRANPSIPASAPTEPGWFTPALGPRGQQWELWTVNLQTSEKRMIGYGLFPSWSPDRSVDRIAFQRATTARQPLVQPLDPRPRQWRSPPRHRSRDELHRRHPLPKLEPGRHPTSAFATVIAPSRGDAVGGSRATAEPISGPSTPTVPTAIASATASAPTSRPAGRRTIESISSATEAARNASGPSTPRARTVPTLRQCTGHSAAPKLISLGQRQRCRPELQKMKVLQG